MVLSNVQINILRVIFDIQGPKSAEAVKDDQIADKLKIDLQEVQDQLELLEEDQYVNLAKAFGPTYSAWLTAKGRVLLRDMETKRAPLSGKSIGVIRKLLYSQTRGEIKQVLLEAGASSDRLLPIEVINDMRSPSYLSKETIITKMFDPIYIDFDKDEADNVLVELIKVLINKGVDVSDAVEKLKEDGFFINLEKQGSELKSNFDNIKRPMPYQQSRHVFISYVRENQEQVDRLCRDLERAGVKVWLDRNDITPGIFWKDAIRKAIRDGVFFIACFSKEYNEKSVTHMSEELNLAIEVLRKRSREYSWLIPVLFSGNVPDWEIFPGKTLQDIQWVPLHDDWDAGIQKILSVIKTIPSGIDI